MRAFGGGGRGPLLRCHPALDVPRSPSRSRLPSPLLKVREEPAERPSLTLETSVAQRCLREAQGAGGGPGGAGLWGLRHGKPGKERV